MPGQLLRRKKAVLAICRFCYQNWEHPCIGSSLATICIRANNDPNIEDIHEWWMNQAPLDAARNEAVLIARSRSATHILMVDNDQVPDLDPSKPFWTTAWNHAWTYGDPCVVVAPIQAADGTVCVHKDVVDGEGKHHLRRMTAEDVAGKTGVERVPGSNVALALIDMRIFDALPVPWFRFEYEKPFHNRVTATEDILFTGALARYDIPVFCAWQAWCGHVKDKILGKP
jgi:hypothetical protein